MQIGARTFRRSLSDRRRKIALRWITVHRVIMPVHGIGPHASGGHVRRRTTLEHGDLAAKPEIGEAIPRGESGPCDPWTRCEAIPVHYTWQKLLKRIPTRRGSEHAIA